METRNLEPILDDPTIKTTEVMIGLSESGLESKLEAYMGDDGRILKATGFDICRVRLTRDCLESFVVGEPPWVDFVEHSGDDGVVPVYNTENIDLNE